MPAIDLPFPIRGVNRIAARDNVPELQSLDARNVVPHDAAEGQLRGGQRAGTDRAVAQQVAGVTARVQGMRQITLAEGAASGVSFDDPFADSGWAFSDAGLLAYGAFLDDFSLSAGPSSVELVERGDVDQITFPDPDDEEGTTNSRDPLAYDIDSFPSGSFTLAMPAQRHYVTVYWSYDDKGTSNDNDDNFEVTQESQYRLLFSSGGTNTHQIRFRDNGMSLLSWDGSAWATDREINNISEVEIQDAGEEDYVGQTGNQYDWPEAQLTFTDVGGGEYEVGISVGGVDYTPSISTPSPVWTVEADDLRIELYELAQVWVNGSFDSNGRRRSSFAPPEIT